MLQRAAQVFMVCVSLSCGVATTSAAGIQVANFTSGETIRYPVPLLLGFLDDENARTVTVLNKSSERPTKELKGIAYKGRFKALAELVPGPNNLVLRSGSKESSITINYKPQTNPYYVQVIYMTDRTGNTKYLTQRQNDPQDFRAKLDTCFKLLQGFTAEQMNRLGFGRLTFNLEFDKEGQLVVHDFQSQEPAESFHRLDDVPLFQEVRKQIETKFDSPHTKRAVYLAFTRYDAASKQLLASNARAGGGTAEQGTAGMWTWPSSLKDVFRVFSDRTPVLTRVMGKDGGGRQTVWAIASGYMGTMLHELQHTWGLPHSHDPHDVISSPGFTIFSRFFVFIEPPSKKNPRAVVLTESEVVHIAPISGSSLKNSRWFALDDKPWKDGGAPQVSARGGDVHIDSEHGLGYLGIDVKGDAIGFKSWGFGGPEPPHHYVLTTAQLSEAAGTTEVRIRAVDVQGQQTDFEVKRPGGK